MSLLHARRLRNGDRIRITWLPSCRNTPGTRNPYIGMEGTVEDLTRRGGLNFSLVGETSVLIVIGRRFRYERLKPRLSVPTDPEKSFRCQMCGFETDSLPALDWHLPTCPAGRPRRLRVFQT